MIPWRSGSFAIELTTRISIRLHEPHTYAGTFYEPFFGRIVDEVHRLISLPVFDGRFERPGPHITLDFALYPTEKGAETPFGEATCTRKGVECVVAWDEHQPLAETWETLLHELVHLCGRSGTWGTGGCMHTSRFKRTLARAAEEAWGLAIPWRGLRIDIIDQMIVALLNAKLACIGSDMAAQDAGVGLGLWLLDNWEPSRALSWLEGRDDGISRQAALTVRTLPHRVG